MTADADEVITSRAVAFTEDPDAEPVTGPNSFVVFPDEDEVPYGVVDEVETNYLHGELSHLRPDAGDRREFADVKFTREGEVLDVEAVREGED